MEDRKQDLPTVFLGILVIVVIGVLLHELQSVFLPLILATLLSYIFKPLVMFMRKYRIPNALALFVVFVFISGVMFGLWSIVYSSVESFVREFPKYQNKLYLLLYQISLSLEEVARVLDIDHRGMALTDIIDVTALTGVVTSSAGSLLSLLGNLMLVLLLMFFILAASGDLVTKMETAFVRHDSQRVSTMIENIDKKIRQYLITKTLISLVTGSLTTMILLLLDVDFALLWGFIAFLLNFIPNIGSITSVFFPVMFSLLQFDTLAIPLLALILLSITQGLIGNVIEPRVMAFSLDLSPLLVLMALVFWGWLWGIVGMILAVPMMATVKIVCENISTLQPVAVLMSNPRTKRH